MKVSFCIPTYNHAQFLGAALDSILAEPPEDFEIVIVDGASTDNTAEVVAQFQRKTSVIVYRRKTVNGGIDVDIAETVALATGDYCWLMSSDDVIPHGAVARVIGALDTGRSLYLGTRLVCTKEMVAFGADGVFDLNHPQTWDFSSQEQLADYLNHSSGLIALFSYISVLAFRRDLWNSKGDNVAAYGTCYAHAYRLWDALASGGTVQFLGEPMVMCRLDTDHFGSRGVFRRFMLDFDGFLGIADQVFGSAPATRQAFLAAIRREHGTFRLARFYEGCSDAEQRRVARARLGAIGYPDSQLLLMRVIASAGPLVRLAVAVRRGLRRVFGQPRLQTS